MEAAFSSYLTKKWRNYSNLSFWDLLQPGLTVSPPSSPDSFVLSSPLSHHTHLLMREFFLNSPWFSWLPSFVHMREVDRKRGDIFSNSLVKENSPFIVDYFLVITSKKQNPVKYNHSLSVSRMAFQISSLWCGIQRGCVAGVSHLGSTV